MMTLIAAIAHQTETFCQHLDKHIEKQLVIAMKSLTDYLALDTVG